MLPAAGVCQPVPLRAGDGRGDPPAWDGALLVRAPDRPRAGQPAPDHRRLPGPPGVVPQLTAHRAVRLSAHHAGRHPAAAKPPAQHQGPRLLCTNHTPSLSRWQQAADMSMLRYSVIISKFSPPHYANHTNTFHQQPKKLQEFTRVGYAQTIGQIDRHYHF